MPNYLYRASDLKGQEVKGIISAANSHEAASKVREKGLVILSISEAKEGAQKGGEVATSKFARGVSIKDLSIFTTQFATMLNSGLSVVKVLDILTKQLTSKIMQQTSEDLKKGIQAGLALSAVMAQKPNIFSNLYISMVKSGETSGKFGESLYKMGSFLERDAEIQRKIKGAMTYPVIVLGASILIVIGLFIFVLPAFTGFLTQLGVPLPLPTKIVIAISDFLVKRWIFLFLVVFAVFFGLKQFLKTEKGTELKDKLMLKIPVIKELVLKTAMARFTDTVSTLFGAGVPLIQCLETTAGTIGNVMISRTIKGVVDGVKRGEPLSLSLEKSGMFTPMVIQMTIVGEESGALEVMLTKVSKFYQEEVDYLISNLTAMINPILMIVVGILIGGVLISLYLPVFKMAGGFAE